MKTALIGFATAPGRGALRPVRRPFSRSTRGLAALWIACGLLLGSLNACSIQPSKDQAPAGLESHSFELIEESLALEKGGRLAYDRGIATLPLRRDDPASSTIEVEFFRFRRAPEASPQTPPIVLLQGGPGFEGLGPRLERPDYFEARLERFTHIADVVVPGQRGFGSSTATPCSPHRTLTLEEALDPELRRAVIRASLEECRQNWRSRGVDLAGFNVSEAASDVADIVHFLGYDRFQLRGNSFGSHWGMAVLRQSPEQVARAVLGSLEGPDHTYDIPSQALATLERIAEAAEASPALASRIPPGGLLAAFQRLIAKADHQPIAVTIEHPVTEEPVTVELDGDDLRQILAGTRRFTQFRFRTAYWPLTLLEILEGDLTYSTETHLWNLMKSEGHDAAFSQYNCGSGVSPDRRERIERDPAIEVLGPTWQRLDFFCAGFEGDLGEDFRRPFQSSVPTVLVHGTWDTGTPIENAHELRAFFDRHHFIRVEGGSHGALREAIEEVEGFRAAMDRFLATGDFEHLPDAVELPAFPWRATIDPQ
ncbi:MAG: alpha/beta hydrolase [Acidobacteriota bacterium]